MSNEGPWIVASLDGKMVVYAEPGEHRKVVDAVLDAPGEVVGVNLREKLAEFRRQHPDTSATFDIDEFAEAVGLSRAGANAWMARGCCLPDVSPRAGRGKRRLWSWRMTFLGSALSEMSAKGIKVDVLVAISRDFAKAKRSKRRKQPV